MRREGKRRKRWVAITAKLKEEDKSAFLSTSTRPQWPFCPNSSMQQPTLAATQVQPAGQCSSVQRQLCDSY